MAPGWWAVAQPAQDGPALQAPELGGVPTQLYVGPEGALVQAGLSHLQRGLLVLDGLLQRCDIVLLVRDRSPVSPSGFWELCVLKAAPGSRWIGWRQLSKTVQVRLATQWPAGCGSACHFLRKKEAP